MGFNRPLMYSRLGVGQLAAHLQSDYSGYRPLAAIFRLLIVRNYVIGNIVCFYKN
jgi:hypothetical protein